MEQRRQHHTPFTADGAVILDAHAEHVAIVASPELARFIVWACNRYDWLMAMFDLCRGEIEGFTLPHRTPSHKEFARLAIMIQDDVTRDGR